MAKIKIRNLKKHIDRILVIFAVITIFLCGSPKIMKMEGLFCSLWLIFAYFVSVRYRLDHKVLRDNLRRYSFLGAWIILTSIILQPPINNYYFVYLLFPLGSVIFMSSLKLRMFRIYLLRCFNLLLICSLVVYLLHQLGIIQSYKDEGLRYWSFYFFNMRWGIIDTPIGGIYKLASIFWEPGQFQIVLIYILCLFIDDILKHISSFKYLISNYSLFVVCLLLTGSTTAYLTLGFLLTGILVVGVRVKRSYKILLIILGMLISVGLFNSSIVQDKFAQKDSAEDNSYNTRLLDNLAALNITLENPIFGAGVCSQKKLNYYLKTDREESSNGWLSTSASFGIPFLLIMLYLMFSNLRVIYGNKIAIVVFITLVFSQAAEAVIYFPYMWLYIFKWKRISDKRTYRKFRIIIRRRELDNLIID